MDLESECPITWITCDSVIIGFVGRCFHGLVPADAVAAGRGSAGAIRLELAAAKSLTEFCLANSLKAVSKVHGVVGVVERTISSEGAYVTSGT